MLSCGNEINPYLDITLARASVKDRSFNDLDTVLIFSRESLSVQVYLTEHIRDVNIHIDNNRLWSKSDSILGPADFKGTAVIFPFSFYDTGFQKIEVKSFLTSGDSVTESFLLYAKSPLYQSTVRGGAGDTAILKTAPVPDEVVYVWEFGDGTFLKDYMPEYKYPVKTAITSSIGQLYVTDRKYRSPSVPFSISSAAVSHQEIKCVNDSIKADSVFTGESDFVFTAEVSGTESLKSASVNGSPFDKSQLVSGSVQLSKTLNSLDTCKGAYKAEVVISDNSGKIISKTFYIYYVADITPDAPVISVKIPVTVNDTAKTIDSLLNMYGSIVKHLQYDSLYLKFNVNGTDNGSILISAAKDEWNYSFNLKPGYSIIIMELFSDKSLSSPVRSNSSKIVIKYTPDLPDNEAPHINSIKINDVAVSNSGSFVSSAEEVVCKILASDNKKVTKVTVNNKTAAAMSDGVTFSVNQLLVHSKDSTVLVICALDSAGNSVCDTLKGLYNRSPLITAVSIPPSVSVDMAHVFIVKTKDDDNDRLLSTVTISRTGADTAAVVLTVKNDSVIWKPAIKDTGVYKVKVRVSDEFYASDDSVLNLNVVHSSGKPVPVKWLTSESDIADSIKAGSVPLSILLKVDSLTGTKPFTYTVWLKDDSLKIYDGSSPQFSWAPERGDGGLRSLMFIVTDSLNSKDTINKLITVVAQPAALVSIVERTLSVIEDSKKDTFTVRLSNPLNNNLVVPYKIEYSSAVSADIAASFIRSVTFIAGDSLVKIPVKLVDDTIAETDELFTITLPALPALSDKDSVAIDNSKSSVGITIKDDDRVGYGFAVSAASASENISEFNAVVKLDREFSSELILTYSLDILKSTADVNDFKFANNTHTLTFSPGQTSAEFIFSIIDDTLTELDEVLAFNLKTDNSLAIAGKNPTLQYTIINDDSSDSQPRIVGVMMEPNAGLTIPEEYQGLAPVIVLEEALSKPLTVTIKATAASTATPGQDYTISSENILIPAGTTQVSIGFKTINDIYKENTESAVFEITGVSDNSIAAVNPDRKSCTMTITSSD